MRHSSQYIADLDAVLAKWDPQFQGVAEAKGFDFLLSEDGDFGSPFRRFSLRQDDPPSCRMVSVCFERNDQGDVTGMIVVTVFYTKWVDGNWITCRDAICSFDYSAQREFPLPQLEVAFSRLNKMVSNA
jgi:hypothetical protein